MRVLVTGAAGFVGRHLTRHLLEGGHEVRALVHPNDHEKGPPLPRPVEVTAIDILDDGALAKLFEASKPDAVYHLAAFSNPESSLKSARQTLETNIIGAQNVLAAAAGGEPAPRVLLVGSAQQYGQVGEADQPIGEDATVRPLTPYAVSKASQELLGLRYFLTQELPVYLTRSFNHTGPGQSDGYVCSSFARQIAEVEKGAREPVIRVGNLAARRDFSDVRDVARAYRAIIERGLPGRVYNVCRGQAVAIQELLDTLVSLSRVRVEIAVDPERYHAVDAPLIVGDNRRLREETGWSPRFSLEATLADLLDDWRGRL